MSYFIEAIKFTLKNEGSYSNNPNDKGGATNFGISTKFFNSIKSKYPELSSCKSVLHLTGNNAELIYSREFFDPLHCSEILDKTLGIKIFDWGVNFGVNRTVEMIQAACNTAYHQLIVSTQKTPDTIVLVKIDGVLGRKTLSAINSFNPSYLLLELINLAVIKYQCIARQDKSQEIFLNGWIARAKRLP